MNERKLMLCFLIPFTIMVGCRNPSGSGAYTLSYSANGADSGSVPGSSSIVEGNSVTVAANEGKLVKAGYPFFVGWNTAADGSGDFYRPGDSMEMPGSDQTLYACWVDVCEITASGGSKGDEFGYSVDIDGDYAVIGAVGYSTYGGAAYVFHRTGINSWDAGTKLQYADSFDTSYGYSVSIDGDYVLVGAPNENSSKGAAFIYQRTGTNSWGNRQVISHSDGSSSDNFGLCVSLDGDYAALGTLTDTVYVYKKGSSGWSNPSETSIDSTESSTEYFGRALSLDGDTLAVGAYGYNSQGQVYVYERTGDNTWGNRAVISAPDPSSNELFGRSVALDGDYLAVGDTKYNNGSVEEQGAAFVFKRSSGNSWGSSVTLMASDGADTDHFGTVAICGDTLLVGAENAAIGNNAYQGAVYMFARTGSNSWDPVTKLTDSDGAQDEFFFEPALDETSLIIGAYGAKDYTGLASIQLYQ